MGLVLVYTSGTKTVEKNDAKIVLPNKFWRWVYLSMVFRILYCHLIVPVENVPVVKPNFVPGKAGVYLVFDSKKS